MVVNANKQNQKRTALNVQPPNPSNGIANEPIKRYGMNGTEYASMLRVSLQRREQTSAKCQNHANAAYGANETKYAKCLKAGSHRPQRSGAQRGQQAWSINVAEAYGAARHRTIDKNKQRKPFVKGSTTFQTVEDSYSTAL
jgi:hypothetical protein